MSRGTMQTEMIKDKETTSSAVAEKQPGDQKSGFYAAIIYFIWPLLSLILAFKNYKSNWAKNILWAFVAFYGLSFAIGLESQNKDIVRYVAELQYLHGIPMSFKDAIRYFYRSGEVDILRTTIAVVLSRFTGSQTVLTLVYGTIFGFFYSRNIWFVLERIKGKIQLITLLLFASFFLLIPMWFINTFRMWTAAHIFIYGALLYLFENKWRGVIIASLAILVHFSFMIPVGMLYVYIFFGNRLIIYFVFFISTFFLAQINLNTFNAIVNDYAPEAVQERTSGYRNKQYVESYREGTGSSKVWYAVWYRRVLNWSVVGLLILLFIRGRNFLKDHKSWLRLFCFSLLFYGVANIFSSLPSGGRYIAVANALALPLIILYIQNKEKETINRYILLASTPFLVLFIVVSVRTALYSLSATAVLGNPVIAIFFNKGHISLNDVMKMII